jgi:hypothetical protein
MKRTLLWLIPLGVLVLFATAILALPGFVASGRHRASIEALASSLTGRHVTIRGDLSLAFTPSPQLIAHQVSIAGPAGDTITARSLTLDVAVPALLRGRLAASSLTLEAPVIAFPWPLPGGPAAVAAPPWLAALHASMTDATISLGAVRFAGVDADVYTAGGGAVTITGTGICAHIPMTVSVSLGAPDAAGRAALTATATADDPEKFDAHFTGTLDGSGAVTGRLAGSVAPPGAAQIGFAAALRADAGALRATGITLTQDDQLLTGSASLALKQPAFTADLLAKNLDLGALTALAHGLPGIPGHVAMTAENASLHGVAIPLITADADFTPDGVNISRLTATLAGNALVTVTGRIDATGAVAGHGSLNTFDLPGLLAGVAIVPRDWRAARVATAFAGDSDQLRLTGLTGQIGPDGFAGALILNRSGQRIAAAGQLHFDQLDLAPIAALLHRFQSGGVFSADGEITADRAVFAPVVMTHLLLDGAIADQVLVRRLSAALYGGIADASFRLGPDGTVTAARALLSIPSATPLAAILPAWATVPAAVLHAPLAVSVMAEGPPTALATSAIATLGLVTVTAAPVLNVPQESATGPFTLRHPDAIAAAKLLGYDGGLAWPGAGSVALRADLAVSPAQIGLPDFVLSLGDLTADGRIIVTAKHQISAQIDADTLALPPWPATLVMPWGWLAAAQGRVDLSANRVWLAGREILGAGTANAVFLPGKVTVTVPGMALAGGNVSGSLTAGLTPGAAPVLTAHLSLVNANASQMTLPVAFPLGLAAGSVTAQAALTASGYAEPAWAATLAGSASLTASNGTLNGFSLTGIVQALKSPDRFDSLRAAATTGTTDFKTASFAGNFEHGNFSLTTATLTGPDGVANASGSVDIPDNDVALETTLLPAVDPPLTLNIATLGNWADPKQIPILRPGLAWSPGP